MPADSAYDTTGYGFFAVDLPAIGVDGPEAPVSVRSWFHASSDDPAVVKRPLEIEIGSGKGTFLVQHAPLHPDTDFLGIEYARQYARHAADRARRLALPNVRVLHAEAGMFLRNFITPNSVRSVHIYFPDPWPKSRHNKRRLVQAPFLRLLHRLLEPGGTVRLATDHLDYFAWMEDHVAQVADHFERQVITREASAKDGELIGTNFERKYREEGRVFNGMTLLRLDSADEIPAG